MCVSMKIKFHPLHAHIIHNGKKVTEIRLNGPNSSSNLPPCGKGTGSTTQGCAIPGEFIPESMNCPAHPFFPSRKTFFFYSAPYIYFIFSSDII